METSQRIYYAAKHTFLKYGYHGTTIEQIARYAASGKATVHYYFRTKENLFELVFSDYIEKLHSELNQNKEFKSHPYEEGIEYPELYDIAWFIANEFRTNREMAVGVVQRNSNLRKLFLSAYNESDWLQRFHNLITAQLKDIILKNKMIL